MFERGDSLPSSEGGGTHFEGSCCGTIAGIASRRKPPYDGGKEYDPRDEGVLDWLRLSFTFGDPPEDLLNVFDGFGEVVCLIEIVRFNRSRNTVAAGRAEREVLAPWSLAATAE